MAVLSLALAALAGFIAAEAPSAPPEVAPEVAPEVRPQDAYLGLTITWTRQSRPLPDGRRGIPIDIVAPGSPAEAAGLRPGDLLVRVDGKRLSTNSEIKMILRQKRPGDRIPIAFVRDGTLQAVDVAVAGMPSVSAGHPGDAQPNVALDGRWIDLDPLRGWFVSFPMQVVERVDGEGPAPGIPAMRITALASPSASYAGASLMTEGPVGPRLDQLRRRRVRFSAMMRCEGASTRAVLWIQTSFLPTAGRPFLKSALDYMPGERGLVPAAGWRRMETVVDIEPTIDDLKFGAELQGLGRLWIAAPRLEEVDTRVPSTSLVDQVASFNQRALARMEERKAAESASASPSAPATAAHGSDL